MTQLENKIKVLFLTNIPSPYRVLFFNELSKRCELTVLYQKRKSDERNEKWQSEKTKTYRSTFLKGINTSVDKAFCPGVIRFLKKSYDAIVICGNASPTELLAIEWCKARKIPYFLEGDGAFAKFGTGIKEKLKRRFISGARYYFSTCRELDKYYLHYGAVPENILRYRFSSLLDTDILPAPMDRIEKEYYRNKLQITEEKIVLGVGSFIPRKGFDVLIRSTQKLPDNIGFYLVGDEPPEEYLSLAKEQGKNNIHFVGFKAKEDLQYYYRAADVFVLPTREDIWGLVVNEAMANGLPVITTNKCNAGLELVKNNHNGLTVPVDDAEQLADAIKIVLDDAEKMGVSALETIRDYSIEKMAEDHILIFKGQTR